MNDAKFIKKQKLVQEFQSGSDFFGWVSILLLFFWSNIWFLNKQPCRNRSIEANTAKENKWSLFCSTFPDRLTRGQSKAHGECCPEGKQGLNVGHVKTPDISNHDVAL